MIALATLAALGQALQAAEIDAVAIAAVFIGIVAVAAVAAILIPPHWEPRRLRKALHEPPPRCFLCGSETDLEPLGSGSLVACTDIEACDQRRRERAGAEGAGE